MSSGLARSLAPARPPPRSALLPGEKRSPRCAPRSTRGLALPPSRAASGAGTGLRSGEAERIDGPARREALAERRLVNSSALQYHVCRGGRAGRRRNAAGRAGPGRAGPGAERGPQRSGDGVAAAASQALGEPAAGGHRGAGLPVSACVRARADPDRDPGFLLPVAGLGVRPLRAAAPLPPWPSPLRRAQRSGPAGQCLRELAAEQSLRGFVGLGGPGGGAPCWGGLGSFALLCGGVVCRAGGPAGGRGSERGVGLWWVPPSRWGEGVRGSEGCWSQTLLVSVESCAFNAVKVKLYVLPRVGRLRVSVPGGYTAL